MLLLIQISPTSFSEIPVQNLLDQPKIGIQRRTSRFPWVLQSHFRFPHFNCSLGRSQYLPMPSQGLFRPIVCAPLHFQTSSTYFRIFMALFKSLQNIFKLVTFSGLSSSRYLLLGSGLFQRPLDLLWFLFFAFIYLQKFSDFPQSLFKPH